MPAHWIHLYEKPMQGTAFVKRLRAVNYRHKISANGWYETASCDLVVTVQEGERFLEQYLGNRVAVIVDNPVEPIWEGYVSRVTFEYGPVVYTISLDEMANRIRVMFNDPDNANPQRLTNAANNTDSQAVYGIKGMFLDGNVYFGASGAGTFPVVLRDTELSLRAWPIASAAYRGGQSAQPIVRLEMRGFYATLDWSIYQQTVSASVAHSTLVSTIIAGDENGATFYDNTDTSGIETNLVSYDQANESGLGLWQMLKQIAEAGDDSAVQHRRWTIGITPTDPNDGKRRFYFRRATPTIAYTARLRDSVGAIRNLYGRVVPAWRVVPDRGIQITDALPGWALQGDDPRIVYLETVDYDGERGLVSFQSSDNITIEGVFRLRRMTKAVNNRFGTVRGSY